MAFIDFREHAAVPAAALPLGAAIPPALAGDERAQDGVPLSPLERRVVALARGDGLASLRPHRRRRWLARLILGPQPPSPVLANERLEALRRLAVHGWHHGFRLPASALREAQAAGYTEAEVGAVVDFIARLREPFRRLAA